MENKQTNGAGGMTGKTGKLAISSELTYALAIVLLARRTWGSP